MRNNERFQEMRFKDFRAEILHQMVTEVLFLKEFAKPTARDFISPIEHETPLVPWKRGIANNALNARTRRELSANSISSISLKQTTCYGGSEDWREIGAKESRANKKKGTLIGRRMTG